MYLGKNLKHHISTKRQEMIDLAFKKGFTDRETVECSQELDDLLNLYNKVTSEKIA
ncbi:Spo0E family sporulation regulatory protein-aspartic acid phosphatase [Virgibacillus indicus]|uniref:Spo0E family sporulation regulatory protein-aspartic acid phosphatase n=1 Tax=Virgibacillus indicus TaxID=2024554 RepID=A0A265N6F6_9BACI|nr:aspartyl-phosphate phosphatase Spo0E family protein [Virgibacillus indicus]OZU87598.1 Spo0E family sporulation regulatory protein-aspartic acid phosphatase [Virgibacillus indicus]